MTAAWADSSIGADANDTISDNTVQLQQLANGIAIYGGHDNTVSGNLVVDTGITQGGGIQVGQRFTSTPVGTTTIPDGQPGRSPSSRSGTTDACHNISHHSFVKMFT